MFTFNIPYKKRWKDWKGNEIKKIEQDIGVFTDVMYAFGSAYGTTPYGMITMGAVSVQKASLGSYKSAYDTALKGLRDSNILQNNLNMIYLKKSILEKWYQSTNIKEVWWKKV